METIREATSEQYLRQRSVQASGRNATERLLQSVDHGNMQAFADRLRI